MSTTFVTGESCSQMFLLIIMTGKGLQLSSPLECMFFPFNEARNYSHLICSTSKNGGRGVNLQVVNLVN